jgi:hypothetical protein
MRRSRLTSTRWPQVPVNGPEGLARKLAQHGVRYTKHDNAFLIAGDAAALIQHPVLLRP